jgi:hypothetical protein
VIRRDKEGDGKVGEGICMIMVMDLMVDVGLETVQRYEVGEFT